MHFQITYTTGDGWNAFIKWNHSRSPCLLQPWVWTNYFLGYAHYTSSHDRHSKWFAVSLWAFVTCKNLRLKSCQSALVTILSILDPVNYKYYNNIFVWMEFYMHVMVFFVASSIATTTSGAVAVRKVYLSTNETFDDNLSNSSSSAFITRAGRVKTQVNKFLWYKQSCIHYFSFQFISFKKGFIFCCPNWEIAFWNYFWDLQFEPDLHRVFPSFLKLTVSNFRWVSKMLMLTFKY